MASSITLDMLPPQVLEEVKAAWKQWQDQEPFLDVVMGFVHAINWKEPWIAGILCTHVVVLLLVLLLRKHSTFLGAVFLTGAGIVYSAEAINQKASQHWQQFAGQQYFDEQGVFFSAVVSAPVLLIMFIILIMLLLQMSRLMVRAKRQQLKHQARQRAAQGSAAAAGSEAKKER